MNRKETDIEALLDNTVKGLGCEIWGIELFAQGRHSKLRVYIDNANGVSVDDCARVSRQVGDVLDIDETFNQSYTLEVSSPGLDRILFKAEQYEAAVGETVDVRLNFPFDGRKHIVGRLAGVEDGQALVQVDDDEFVLPIENVQRARIVPQFDG